MFATKSLVSFFDLSWTPPKQMDLLDVFSSTAFTNSSRASNLIKSLGIDSTGTGSTILTPAEILAVNVDSRGGTLAELDDKIFF